MDLNQLNQYVGSTCTVYTDGGEASFPDSSHSAAAPSASISYTTPTPAVPIGR